MTDIIRASYTLSPAQFETWANTQQVVETLGEFYQGGPRRLAPDGFPIGRVEAEASEDPAAVDTFWRAFLASLPASFHNTHQAAPDPTLARSQAWADSDTVAEDLMAQPQPGDPVVLPDHYARYKIEPIRFGVENFGRGVLVTKIVKYVMRSPFKGKPMEDLDKAMRCLIMLKAFDAGDPDWWKADRPHEGKGPIHLNIHHGDATDPRHDD